MTTSVVILNSYTTEVEKDAGSKLTHLEKAFSMGNIKNA